ncbi:MAG: response regulator, partial [Gammaproteobacteria bacterium]|nr:response regulator [Gammaproteobacteria bacterium]
PNIQISLVFSDGNILGSPPLNISPKMLSQQSNLLSSENHENALLLDHKSHFIHVYAWPTNTGHNYLVISQSKVNLTTALNTTRQSIIIIFLFIAALAIISGILWLNQFITKPVNALVAHADVDENSAYPVFPISESNDEIGLLGKVLNSMVDKIKEREESLTQTAIQLKNTQNLAKIGGWEQDHIHNTMKWSEEVFRILDLDSKNTIPSPELIAEHIHPDDLPLVKIAYLESVTNKKSYDVTHRIQLEDGTEKHVHVYTETQYDENGLPAITIGTIQDTSEQILLDEQMRRTQKMDALGKLTGGIAHDFNNLLGVILGFTELLQLKTDANKNPKDADFLAQIYQAGDRAQKLTSKLLAFSRTETPTADLVDVNQLIKEEQHLLEKTLTVRIKLTFNFQDEIWPVWLDKNELKDTLLNMSINSMHAMPNGGELTLDTHNIHLDDLDIGKLKIPPGDYILLTITDTGIGMDRQTSQRMFEPFFTTKQEKGTGLGMSQVYGFVQRAKGAIHVYSELNHGTRISIYFPRYFPEINNGRQRKHTIKYENLSGSEKILVVDDELSLRNLASEILSAQGYQVISAKNGKDALEILKSEQIDILFSDVIMPEMDGYKLASIVKKQYPSIKIQLASGFSNTDLNTDQQELYEQRLSKPFTSKDLLRKIQTLTQKPNVSVKKELNL